MRLQSHANKLITNIQAETQNFGIGDTSVVIEILRNRLYEHKVRTLVQEYMCNARDAMREIGNNNPIEVTLPTRFNPTFKVRDFGPGITPERMQNVFVMYGSSTKRKDNSQTGGFGIGAKSAWSYTDSFTIVTYINGTKRTYVAHTGVNNNGRLDLISTDSTTDKNGTEIQIAVKQDNINEFVNSAFRAAYFWDVKPIFRGSTEKLDRETGLTFVKNLEIVRGSLPDFLQLTDRDLWHTSKVGLVIDGIPYKITSAMLEKCKALEQLHSLIGSFALLYLPNGFIEVSASRESISDSALTVKNLDAVAIEMYKTLKSHVKTKFDKVKEVSEFLNTYKGFQFYLNMEAFQCDYKGYTVSRDSIKSDIFKKVQLTRYDYKRTYRVNNGQTSKLRTNDANALALRELNNVYVVKADDSLIMRNRRIREMLNSQIGSMVVLSPLNGDTASFDKVKSDLKIGELNIELPQITKVTKAKVKREDAEFCMHTYDGNRHVYTTLASNKEQWLYLPREHKFEAVELKELSGHGFINICILGARALAMVQKDKNFTLLTDWITSYKPNASQLARAKYQAAKNIVHMKTLCKVIKHGLKDTQLKTMLEEYETFLKHDNQLESSIISGIVKNSKEFKEFEVSDEALSKLIKDRYPLLNDLNNYSKETAEIAFYLNAKHVE